uniref:Integrase, catalytic region, zinc finger, CCHC-type, peptidase aspartic, catalytic n=1 Tax=Tanacetum cinerariifolium TaxID=118510 RepID=A0A6L2NB99_TANCI|nr:integrase, catalytic region, zinc finger, CCHC-type, peptidase aspartic, catalytic [Tanacetum cinerariifolium]
MMENASEVELYKQNRKHGRMILESVEHGPLIWPTIEENGVTTTKKYEELSATEKIQADCDLKETNIIIQGLPSDVYSLVNHHRVAKDLWERLRNSSNPRRQETIHDGRDKVLLVEAQGSGKVLNKEELYFLADPKVAEGPATQTVITHNVAYQADYLDAYDSDYDDFSTTKAVLMASLSSYGSDVLSEVPHSENTHNDMLNQSVQEMLYYGQTHLVNYPENEITSNSNIIPYSLSIRTNLIANESLSAELERYKERVKLIEERQYFGKRFLPQQELSGEQAFQLQTSHSNTDQSASSPVKIEATRELPKVVQSVLWYLDSICSKHMIGDRSQLPNFVYKFLGTVKFDNDQNAKIMGYGDHQIRNIIISKIHYVEGLRHDLFSIGQFCDSDLEVAFRKHTCFVRSLKGVDLLSGS